MTDNKIIHNLIEEELAAANKIHPLFQSPHEAYAVMLEEFEEVKEELHACEKALNVTWGRVKNDIGAADLMCILKGHAVYLIQEGIQLAAMAQKTLDSLYKKG